MKNILIAALSLSLIVACTKKNNKAKGDEIVLEDSTSVVQDNETLAEGTPVPIKEWSKEAVQELVKAKSNDTLYVTNFFATWCGPCVRELPHFREKMEQMKGQPVKFTFISLDQKEDWETMVPQFAQQHGIANNVVLLNGEALDLDFFRNSFKTWTGGSIPFTIFTKNGKTDEYSGMMSPEILEQKLNQF